MSDVEMEQQPEQEPMGMGAKLINIFTTPSEVFVRIRERVSWQDWVIPVLIAIVFAGTAGVIRAPYNETIAKSAIEAQRDKFVKPDMTADQQKQLNQRFDEQLQKQQKRFSAPTVYPFSYGSKFVSILLSVLILAGLYYFAGNTILGGQAKYGKVLAVVTLPQMVTALQAVYQMVMTAVIGQVDIPSNLSVLTGYSTLGLFSLDRTHQALYTFLSHFDVFTIWRLILFVIGFRIIYKVSRGKAAGVVFGFWALWIVITTVGTFLFAGIGA